MIIASIDLMNGKAVQLVQGKTKVLEFENPVEIAKKLAVFGPIQIIDLDAAFGKGDNLEIVKEIAKFAEVRVGGGIRTVQYAKKLIVFGADKIIIGTKSNKKFLKQLNKQIPKERIIVALDSKNGFVVKDGWRKSTKQKAECIIKKLEPYCSEFFYTCVDNEGLMQGTNIEEIKKLKKLTRNQFSAAGGISSIPEIVKLNSIDVDSILGMALYTRKINLEEAFLQQLRFRNKLIPTIVQDFDTKQVLMLAYSNKESVLKTFETGKCFYYSRSRKKLWQKGESSGNYQQIVRAKADCDYDTLLYQVKQKNVACHTGKYSCFSGIKENNASSLNTLFETLRSRKDKMPAESYTAKLLKNKKLLVEKIREESDEVIEAMKKNDSENLIWEISDLIYFLATAAIKQNISQKQIFSELQRRMKK
ncbi:MAG: bifunctional phosphoribosyl-AMP cyclohydrolase/phosphoribosyl-ATP diphosphatase HisIE [archaeon]